MTPNRAAPTALKNSGKMSSWRSGRKNFRPFLLGKHCRVYGKIWLKAFDARAPRLGKV
jgi:hypothetical protein